MVTEGREAGKNRLTQRPLPLRNASINRNMNALGHFIDTDVSIFQPKRAPLRQRRCDNPHPSAFFFLSAAKRLKSLYTWLKNPRLSGSIAIPIGHGFNLPTNSYHPQAKPANSQAQNLLAQGDIQNHHEDKARDDAQRAHVECSPRCASGISSSTTT